MVTIKKVITAFILSATCVVSGCGYAQKAFDNPEILSEDIAKGINKIDEKVDNAVEDKKSNDTVKVDPNFTGEDFEKLVPVEKDAAGNVITKIPLRGTVIDAAISHDNVDTSGDITVFYRVVGEAVPTQNVQPQEVRYGKLDDMGRATGVWAMVTYDMFKHSEGKPRYNKEYKNDPPGWKAEETSISTGSNQYNGYFYNRSHLLGDLLGGRFFENNMVTGTRMQNVGWNGNNGAPDGGMAYTEKKVADHFKNLEKKNEGKLGQAREECNVYYSAVPNYINNDLVPRTVTVDVLSCDGKINERVIVDNTAPGFIINYEIGNFIKTG